MTSKTANKFSSEVRDRAVRLLLYHEREHPSRWQAIVSIAAKIGCSAHTLNEWVKKVEVDTGRRAGVTTDTATRLKALDSPLTKSGSGGPRLIVEIRTGFSRWRCDARAMFRLT